MLYKAYFLGGYNWNGKGAKIDHYSTYFLFIQMKFYHKFVRYLFFDIQRSEPLRPKVGASIKRKKMVVVMMAFLKCLVEGLSLNPFQKPKLL